MALSPAPEAILTVTQLTARIKGTLEEAFPAVWVKGEISNFRGVHGSGHAYFCIKDASAQIDVVVFRTTLARLGFPLRDGVQVEAFGQLTVYPQKGDYQLVVREMRPAGLGALLLALEDLKRRLAADGLFDAARKRPLPAYPRRIGLVTSPVGAAVRDMVKVLRTRWPSIGIVLAPVRVQGEGAAAEIAEAIERFGRLGGVDTLIVGRGGGSIEDLWAFNEEIVVRAIVASPIPVISAVGHEVDVTLADLAADVRAATPSNAAERAVRVRDDVARAAARLRADLDRAIVATVSVRRQQLADRLGKYGFQRQGDVIRMHQQRVDDLGWRMRTALGARVAATRERLVSLAAGYGLREFPRTLAVRRDAVRQRAERLIDRTVDSLLQRRVQLQGFGDRLRALSPRAVMERGFCLVRGADGTLLRQAAAVAAGDRVTIEFSRGEADARIEDVRTGGRHGA